MTQYFEEFKNKLQEMFMTDTDLDFGIYRIMKAKHAEIEKFIDTDLKKTVDEALSQGGKGDKQEIKKQMQEIKLRMGNVDLHTLPEAIPDVKKYLELEKQLASSIDVAQLEDDVYSHLTNFFSRYYDNGDFVSNRRYSSAGSSYVIPYDGEEVKLHWANNDQYYIKTSENFHNYRFNAGGYAIRFEIVNINTEQNNNKSSEDKKRAFMLYSDAKEKSLSEDTPDVETFELADLPDAQEGMPAKEFIVRFVYDIPSVKKETVIDQKTGKEKEQDIDWTERAYAAIMAYTKDNANDLKDELSATYKTSKKDVLRHHLDSYVGKNSFDYFIHKDLGRFLRFELDYYIKNEVLLLQDLDIDTVSTHLNVAKAIKTIGEKVITLLAQIEDFQKKLWLKKKFVLQSNYCITLDRVPTSFYAEIAANEKQRREWVRLFAIDKIKGDTMSDGYSEPLTVKFLEENRYLVLDTAFFSPNFKHRLETAMKDVDKSINGLLINSENFQALELLQEKYAESIQCAYYDPPYNTKSNEFVYKDTFKHSSWMAMMNDRLQATFSLLNSHGAVMVSCDENEVTNLRTLLYNLKGEENYLADIIWQGGGKNDQKYISVSHEYIEVCLNNKAALDATDIRWQERKENIDKIYDAFEKIKKQYPNDYEKQEKALKAWYKDLPDSEPAKRQKHFCKVEKRGIYFAADISKPENGYYYDVLHPVTGKPCKKPKGGWRFIEETMKQQIADDRVLFGPDETTVPCRKSFLKETEYESPSSVIYLDNRVSTAFMQSLFNDKKIFNNPKYYPLIARLLKLAGDDQGWYIDCFAGSGTTGHSVVHLNRQDGGQRKFILCEMGQYFNKVTKPRMEKVVYSTSWKNGSPVASDGISQCFKYLRLEQYEDTLNNLSLVQPSSAGLFNESDFSEGYLLHYMLDTETRGSLFNLEWFVNPFDMHLMASENNEVVDTEVDLVETFNYLIGLEVESISWNEDESICAVVGKKHIDGDKVLVLWRNCSMVDNDKLNAYFAENCKGIEDLDIIYANGNSLLGTMKAKSDHWTVELTEAEFMNKMFNLEEAE